MLKDAHLPTSANDAYGLAQIAGRGLMIHRSVGPCHLKFRPQSAVAVALVQGHDESEFIL